MSQKPSRRRPQKLKLTDLLRRSTTDRQQARFYEEVTGESDRAAVLILTAEIDHTLEGFIKFEFHNELSPREEEDLFSASAPLATFAAKIRLCYAFGYYGPISRNNLLEISRIRNIFAHSPLPVTFRTPQIRRACKKLDALQAYMAAGLMQRDKYTLAGLGTRDTFILTALAIASIAMSRFAVDTTKATQEMGAIVAEFRRRKARGQDTSAFRGKVKIP